MSASHANDGEWSRTLRGPEEVPVTNAQRPAALDGVVVADFGRVLAAPYGTMLLGDLGAEVVKVERPGSGDDTRAWGPPFANGQATYYLSVNRNKRSLAVDLQSSEGRGMALELVRRADVLVENFRPGTMDRLGLGWELVREVNPGLVYCSITGFGAGAGAALPGYDLLVQAAGGLMSVTGACPDRPMKAGVALVDVLTGLHACVGILAALRERARSGRGQRVSVNLLSTLLSSMVNQAAGYTAAGVVPRPMGNRHPSIAPYEVLPTADQPIVIAVGNDRQFVALCDALGLPSLRDDPRFVTNSARVAHVDELAALLMSALRGNGAGYWYEVFTPLGIPCGPVNDMAGAFALAEQLGIPGRVTLGAPGEEIDLPANPIELSATPPSYRRHPPRPGENTDEVLSWLTHKNLDAPQGKAS